MPKHASLLLVLAIAAYLLSLFLPGIVCFRPPYNDLRRFSGTEAIALARAGTACHDVVGRPLEPGISSNNASAAAKTYECSVPSDKRVVYPGYFILAVGWLGAFSGIVAWYGNLLGLGALVVGLSKYSPRLAVSFAFAGFVVGWDALLLKAVPEGEGGFALPVDHLGVGFYIWDVSLLLLALALLAMALDSRRGRNVEAVSRGPGGG